MPKWLMFGEFAGARLSCASRVLYMLMLERHKLSVKNNWFDPNGDAYIYFKVEDIENQLGVAKATAMKLKKELSEKSLMIEVRQGMNKPNKLYLLAPMLNDSKTTEYHDTFQEDNPEVVEITGSSKSIPPEVQNLDFRKSKNHTSESSEFIPPEVQKLDPNKKKISKNEMNKNEKNKLSSLSQSIISENNSEKYSDLIDGIDVINKRKLYKAIIRNNIDYETLLCSQDAAQVDEIVEIILEVVCSPKEHIRINSTDIESKTVKERLLNLNQTHIEYVIHSLNQNTTQVKNIKAYLLTMLYNSKATISNYYAAKVSHDAYGLP